MDVSLFMSPPPPPLCRLMSHLKTHVAKMAKEDCHMGSVSPCPHCFRRFSSPFRLQSHVEAVHTRHVSTGQ